MSAFDDLVKMLKKEKKSGSDYTGTVTRVEGNTAYVQLTGSDIADTPVAMSISAKPGDNVRVRVSNGKAHITGNDTAPPTNDTEKIQKLDKSNDDVLKRIKKVEDGIKMEGIVHFVDLENPDEETIIKGGNIDAVSMAIKDSYSMYNGSNRQRILAFDKSEPFPGVENYMIVIDPDENIPACYINTENTWVKAFTASTEDAAALSLDSGLFYVDMPIYNASAELLGTTRMLQAAP